MAKTKKFSWKNPGALTVAVIIVMFFDAIWAAAGLAIALTWGPRAEFINVDVESWGLPQYAGWLQAVLALPSLFLLIVPFFWILRVSKNAHVLKGRKLNNSPMFAALWWYVIPFMSLFKPVEALFEIWDVSAIDARVRNAGRIILSVWWGSTLLVNFSRIAARLIANSPEASGAIPAANALVWSVSIIQCLAFVVIAARISTMQSQKQRVSEFSDPEPQGGVLAGLTA